MWGRKKLDAKSKSMSNLPGKAELGQKVENWNVPGTTIEYSGNVPAQRPERPFLSAIRQDRIAKQVEMNALERQLNKLWELERAVETHESVDEVIRYFLEKSKCDSPASIKS